MCMIFFISFHMWAIEFYVPVMVFSHRSFLCRIGESYIYTTCSYCESWRGICLILHNILNAWAQLFSLSMTALLSFIFETIMLSFINIPGPITLVPCLLLHWYTYTLCFAFMNILLFLKIILWLMHVYLLFFVNVQNLIWFCSQDFPWGEWEIV